jgi:Na+-transporting NADH:ubiquinone oxidoreductase subunit A
VIKGLADAGLFSVFRTRPFDLIPSSEQHPEHIFINALDTNPFATNPRHILDENIDQFRTGVELVSKLTNGTVFVCQSPGTPLCNTSKNRIVDVAINGPHPAGNTSTLVNQIYPINRNRLVWAIDYQEVCALGYLLDTGSVHNKRVVTVYDLGNGQTELQKCDIGSDVAALDAAYGNQYAGIPVEMQLEKRLWCGNLFTGSYSQNLRRFDHQVFVNSSVESVTAEQAVTAQKSENNQKSSGTIYHPLIAEPWLEDISPLTGSLTLLLRALLCGDSETAEACGCLRFAEEDIAHVSQLTNNTHDFSKLLKLCNEQIRADLASVDPSGQPSAIRP